jgi:sugar-specific transcriptional regulator TrmB
LRLAPVVPYGKDRSLTQSGDSDLIDRLVRHGLGQGEARCYVGMLGQRAFKVSEVAIEAGLPRSRAYELIRSLVRFGLCTEVAGGGYARFRAVPPNEAIGRLEASRAEQSRRRDLALTGLQQALAERSRPSPESGQEPVEMLRRREQLLTEMAKEVCQATEESGSGPSSTGAPSTTSRTGCGWPPWPANPGSRCGSSTVSRPCTCWSTGR